MELIGMLTHANTLSCRDYNSLVRLTNMWLFMWLSAHGLRMTCQMTWRLPSRYPQFVSSWKRIFSRNLLPDYFLDRTVSNLSLMHLGVLHTKNRRLIDWRVADFVDAGDDGFGFTVVTRAGHSIGQCMLYVKKILEKGAAAKDGRLKPGDLILEVNK